MSLSLPQLTLTTSTSSLSPFSSTSPTFLTVSLSQTSPVTQPTYKLRWSTAEWWINTSTISYRSRAQDLGSKTSRPKRSSQERFMRYSLTEDMNEFGKVGADTSHLQSQMHSDHDSPESIADSDLEDGERRRNAGFTCICRMEKTMNPLECQSHR